MKGNLLIVGMGQGLGRKLVELKNDYDHVIGISRSRIDVTDDKLIQLHCDIKNLDTAEVAKLPGDIELVIYLVSEWGESSQMLVEEFDKFTNSGPRALLNLFHLLKAQNKLKAGAVIVSVGSIASQFDHYSKRSHPMYASAKLLQKTIMSKLAATNPDYRFAVLTLGSLQHLGYASVVDAVRSIKSLAATSQFIELELLPANDIAGFDCA
ncbi:hypothetical protein ACMZOO_04420 [Catenovulum sp. SX2]|uniref:hypothetical protein n=1 Tax=Catenovulum sp. SX2 TaxID=3398614 RepID=UPI003F85FE5A